MDAIRDQVETKFGLRTPQRVRPFVSRRPLRRYWKRRPRRTTQLYSPYTYGVRSQIDGCVGATRTRQCAYGGCERSHATLNRMAALAFQTGDLLRAKRP